MVVNDFDPLSMSVCPHEAQAPLPTDAYAVLAESIALEGYQVVALTCPFSSAMMDKRGEGVQIILDQSERLSGHRPVYRLVDDSELLLVIPAAAPSEKPTPRATLC